jgi:hypothetical protein
MSKLIPAVNMKAETVYRGSRDCPIQVVDRVFYLVSVKPHLAINSDEEGLIDAVIQMGMDSKERDVVFAPGDVVHQLLQREDVKTTGDLLQMARERGITL